MRLTEFLKGALVLILAVFLGCFVFLARLACSPVSEIAPAAGFECYRDVSPTTDARINLVNMQEIDFN
jgi:hypothetical protein